MSEILTPVKAIRAKCIECSGGSMYEARMCPITECALYPYRLGHRPPKDAKNEGFSDCNISGDKNIIETI